MQLIRVVPHGTLAQLYDICMIAGNSVSEVIEGWSRQTNMAEIPLQGRPILQVAGFNTKEELEAPLEAAEVHIFPAMFGGGGFGKILMGAAMIGVAFIPGINVIAAGLKAALIVAGATMALTGVVELFMGAPSLSKEEDPEASKYLGSGNNTTAIGTPIPIGGGRVKVGGHLLSMQVNSNDFVNGKFPTTPT